MECGSARGATEGHGVLLACACVFTCIHGCVIQVRVSLTMPAGPADEFLVRHITLSQVSIRSNILGLPLLAFFFDCMIVPRFPLPRPPQMIYRAGLRCCVSGQVEKVAISNPHAACKYDRVEHQMLKEDEKDQHERAKLREQQRKRQHLLDHRSSLEAPSRVSNASINVNGNLTFGSALYNSFSY